MNPKTPRRLLLLALATLLATTAHADPATYDRAVAEDHPFLHLRFGAQTADATYAPGVTLSNEGPAGLPCATFDGKTGCITLNSEQLNHANALTVECWFRSSQPFDAPYWPASATLLSKATPGASSSDWALLCGSKIAGHNQGRILAATGPNGAPNDALLYSRGHLNDNEWHYLVWSREQNGDTNLYIDAHHVDAGNDGGTSITNDTPIRIGGDPNLAGSTFFQGSISELALYSEALSRERILAHYEIMPRMKPSPSKDDLFKPGRGIFALQNVDTDEMLWLSGNKVVKDASSTTYSGDGEVCGVRIHFSLECERDFDDGQTVVRNLVTRWSLEHDLDGWEVCLAGLPGSDYTRSTMYPFAGNQSRIDVDHLGYVGVPAAIFFNERFASCPSLSIFGIAPNSDYLNPKTWMSTVGFRFQSDVTYPQFVIGHGKLLAGIQYEFPIQAIMAAESTTFDTVIAAVEAWIKTNDYKVEPLNIRTPQASLDLFLKGRRATNMWREGMGYQLQDVWPAIYIPVNPKSAYFDYRTYEDTGDTFWRDRALQQMDFTLKAQDTDPASPNFGVIQTCYLIDTKTFNSEDRGTNPGLKIDMTLYTAEYLLKTWDLVRKKEGIDHQDWYQAAVHATDWAVHQQNPDGGLPQKLDPNTGKPSISVVSGRGLVALPYIYSITKNDAYQKVIDGMETFLRNNCEAKFWFTGQHPDLLPGDYESDSVWCAIEYWLTKYDRTHDADCLRRAKADAYFAFLMWCPKQLSWVKNPTQTCHNEQQRFLQYSNYCYHNKKLTCLKRLGELTGEQLFTDLFNRVMQSGFWCTVTEGNYTGAQHERTSDPWLKTAKDYNDTGSVYLNELALDANLQLLEMGLAKPTP